MDMHGFVVQILRSAPALSTVAKHSSRFEDEYEDVITVICRMRSATRTLENKAPLFRRSSFPAYIDLSAPIQILTVMVLQT